MDIPTEPVFHRMPIKVIVRAHLIINCILALFAYCVVVVRIRLRKTSAAGIGKDDVFILLAMPQATGMLIIQGLIPFELPGSSLTSFLPGSFLGVGYPLTEAIVNLPLILRLLVAYELIFALATMTIKLSALFFYLRVFVNRTLQLATKMVMLFVLVWSFGNVLQVFLICRPFRSTYDPSVTGKCGSQVASFIAIGVFNAVTDLVILALPIHTVWTLKARVGLKIALTTVFLIGLVTTGVSVARIVALTSLDLSSDLTGTMVYASVLSTTEPLLGIICISLPMLRPLFRWSCFQRLKSTNSSSKKYQHRSSNLRTFGNSGREDRHYHLEDSVVLQTVYAAGHEGHTNDYKVEAQRMSSNDDGSETELAPGGRLGSDKGGAKIIIERNWAISRA